MRPSREIPTNVNAVRPADIKVVAALGDSLTSANGAGAEDPVAIILQYRGLAFQIGGDKNLSTHVTIPNILKAFNPNVFGASYGIGTQNVYEISQLNIGQPGARAGDLAKQARELVSRMQTHAEVDFQNDWKLVNIFIGGNDICAYCHDPNNWSGAHFGERIAEAVQILYDQVPRVIVSVTSMLHLEMVRQIDQGELFCQGLHLFECKCESDKNFTNAEIDAACTSYQVAELSLQTSGKFEKEDFTLVIQPFFNEIRNPPMQNGHVMLSLFCPDCFHFAQLGHAHVATWLWKNIMEPVGSKTIMADLSTPPPLACPDTTCPFIRTVQNSASCGQFYTEPADDVIH